MSRNFLFALLSITVAGLLWGAHGGSPDGGYVDNNESSAKVVANDGVSSRSLITRVPYVVLRTASRLPMMMLRTFARLPRQVAVEIMQSLGRLMRATKDYAFDVLGYLASSERTELVRVRRGVPARAEPPGSSSSRRGINLVSIIGGLFTYPLKVVAKTASGLVHHSPIGSFVKMVLAPNGIVRGNPLVRRMNNVTKEMVDYAVDRAWNFTKGNVLPQLDSFVNKMKGTDAVPQSLMSILIELQTLYHIFKFLGMA